ncbi:hypothetical protein [Mesorhizobium sp. LjNodule214]|uniref:hypothetical protein n=1 Tax=Mesorhizobium sp. LjNodule214 TaxID=3342252 RepID=UPI003ECC6500
MNMDLIVDPRRLVIADGYDRLRAESRPSAFRRRKSVSGHSPIGKGHRPVKAFATDLGVVKGTGFGCRSLDDFERAVNFAAVFSFISGIWILPFAEANR